MKGNNQPLSDFEPLEGKLAVVVSKPFWDPILGWMNTHLGIYFDVHQYKDPILVGIAEFATHFRTSLAVAQKTGIPKWVARSVSGHMDQHLRNPSPWPDRWLSPGAGLLFEAKGSPVLRVGFKVGFPKWSRLK